MDSRTVCEHVGSGAYARRVSDRAGEPIGVLLAGGEGRRIGGGKALVELGGRPLISYPLAAMRRAVRDVAVVAKADTELPALPGVALWIEPGWPRHPLVGIVHALRCARGRAVLVCAADMPFVIAQALTALARADAGGAPAVVATSGGGLQPQLGRYEPLAPCGYWQRRRRARRCARRSLGSVQRCSRSPSARRSTSTRRRIWSRAERTLGT